MTSNVFTEGTLQILVTNNRRRKIFFFRSVYPFNTPGAFVPHSAINLSRTKEEESPVSQSLDLSVSESGAGASVSSTGGNITLKASAASPFFILFCHLLLLKNNLVQKSLKALCRD